MEIEKKFLLPSAADVPGAPERMSRIEQYYLDPAQCALEKMAGHCYLKAGDVSLPLDDDALASRIPDPLPERSTVRLRRHVPVRPGKEPLVLCFKWEPASASRAKKPEERKTADTLVNEELDFPLQDLAAWDALLPYINGRLIVKTRHYFERLIPGHVVELDVFEGELAGLVVAEVECPDLDDAARLEQHLPPFLAGARNVSGDSRYANRRLALDGLPKG